METPRFQKSGDEAAEKTDLSQRLASLTNKVNDTIRLVK